MCQGGNKHNVQGTFFNMLTQIWLQICQQHSQIHRLKNQQKNLYVHEAPHIRSEYDGMLQGQINACMQRAAALHCDFRTISRLTLKDTHQQR